jgi:tetratricopeptide (TPR) repeat protein
MRFRAFPDRRTEARGQRTEDGGRQTDAAPSSDIRWTFDDGVVKTGRTVERVFLGCSKHIVTVQMVKGTEVLAETRHVVYAGARADKMWVEPRDPKAFQREIAQTDFRKAPIQDVVRLHTIGSDLPEPSWKKMATQVLLERVSELMARPDYQPLCLELGQHLSSAAVQHYDLALNLYTKLQEKTREGTPLRQQTMVAAGELLLRCLGKPEAALRLLNQARWEKAQDKTGTIRLGLARAEALLALGDTKELEAQMGQLRELQGKQDPRRQDLRRAGLLDQAAFLAGQKNDPAQWDYAMSNVETILREEPGQVLSPGLNLVRLDVHLARREYQIARHLAERLAKLDLTPYDRAQVLLRHTKTLCALGDPDAAKKVLEQLTQVYPNSQQAAQARVMVVEAATKARKQ